MVAFICQRDHTACSGIPHSSADWFASVLFHFGRFSKCIDWNKQINFYAFLQSWLRYTIYIQLSDQSIWSYRRPLFQHFMRCIKTTLWQICNFYWGTVNVFMNLMGRDSCLQTVTKRPCYVFGIEVAWQKCPKRKKDVYSWSCYPKSSIEGNWTE